MHACMQYCTMHSIVNMTIQKRPEIKGEEEEEEANARQSSSQIRVPIFCWDDQGLTLPFGGMSK